ISPHPNVTAFARDYAPPHAWRGSLGVQRRLLHAFTVSLDASYARGSSQYGFRDLNLVAAPHFTLTDEAARPVYVPVDSIVPATVTLPIASALELGAIGRLTSGAPFTPVVGSDINGDGARNDRAFIFVPATAPDTAVGNAMRTLIADAPGAVRRCLVRQLARVAARNSCAGPWQPSFDLQLSWRPAWFGLERRLTLSALTVNLMGGLDEWLHGAGNLRGWGYASAP